jgi:hypothetical protein
MCSCLNGLDKLGNAQLTPENIMNVAQNYAYINPYADRIRSIDEDYGIDVANAVKAFYETGKITPPSQPNKIVLNPGELKQLFIELKLDINKMDDRLRAMQSITARPDIDVEATNQMLNSIPLLNNGNNDTPSTESNSGLLVKALLAFGIGYGIKKIFFNNKNTAKSTLAGVQAKRKVEIVQF